MMYKLLPVEQFLVRTAFGSDFEADFGAEFGSLLVAGSAAGSISGTDSGMEEVDISTTTGGNLVLNGSGKL